jgi:hypothetical protein
MNANELSQWCKKHKKSVLVNAGNYRGLVSEDFYDGN